MFSIKSTALAILAIVVILAGVALSIRHEQRTIDHQAQQLKDERAARSAAEAALAQARDNEATQAAALREQNDAINLLESAGRQQQQTAQQRALRVLHNPLGVDLHGGAVYTLWPGDDSGLAFAGTGISIGNAPFISAQCGTVACASGAEGMNSWLHARFPSSR